MDDSTKKHKILLQNLFTTPYRIGRSILIIGFGWLMIGFLVHQQLIFQEAFMLFIASGLLWLVGNLPYLTGEFMQWSKQGLSIVLFFLLFLTGLVLLGNQQQILETKDAQRLGYQLVLIALSNIFIGLTEIIFRVFNQRRTK